MSVGSEDECSLVVLEVEEEGVAADADGSEEDFPSSPSQILLLGRGSCNTFRTGKLCPKETSQEVISFGVEQS